LMMLKVRCDTGLAPYIELRFLFIVIGDLQGCVKIPPGLLES